VIRTPRTGALAFALLVLPAAVAAQARPADARAPRAPAAPPAGAVREWVAELQSIGTRLQAAHSRALGDEQLRRMQDQLMRDMEAAMLRVDPELDRLAERARAIDPEMKAARRQNDRARYQALARELGQIQQRVMRAQDAVLRQPPFAARARGHDELLRREMMKWEPALDSLLERSKELQARVNRAMQQAQPAGPRRRTP
jgi:predicted  nucleic acid-binding Zn-ribbon protein